MKKTINASSNAIELSGNLTKDLFVNDKKNFAKGTIAHNTGRDGKTVFMNFSIFAKKGETLSIPEELMKSGARVALNGYLRGVVEDFTAKNGVAVHKEDCEIVVNLGNGGWYKANEMMEVGSQNIYPDYNKVTLSARVVKDPFVNSEKTFARLRIAHNCGKDNNGENRPSVFFDIAVFPKKKGDKVDDFVTSLKTADSIEVTGALRAFEDTYTKDGVEKTKKGNEIVVNGHGSINPCKKVEIEISDDFKTVSIVGEAGDDLPEEL